MGLRDQRSVEALAARGRGPTGWRILAPRCVGLASALIAAAFAGGGRLTAAELKTFASPAWGIALRYPADLAPSETFTPNYFDRGAWRVSYAADVGAGARIVAFALPPLRASDAGGDSEATAELRIGASRDPDVVASCLAYGMNSGDNVETAARTLGGVTFTEVPDNGDGGMQQRISSDDLRAVHDGACYAVDLVQYVGGTSNRRLSYAPEQIDRLRRIIDSIEFR